MKCYSTSEKDVTQHAKEAAAWLTIDGSLGGGDNSTSLLEDSEQDEAAT